MTSLDRRDRRRALKIASEFGFRDYPTIRKAIAAALKREREETGFAAIGHLFALRDQKNALKAFEANHGPVSERTKRRASKS